MSMFRTRRAAVAMTMVLAAGLALADNPLVINGALESTDQIAIGYDGPNSPGPSTFYYDLYTFTVDTDATYSFTMETFDGGLAPWIGVYDNNFSALDYFSPAPIDLAAVQADPNGASASIDIHLAPGTYQALASSVDWIEEPDALDEGPYKVTIAGPAGADIQLIPVPGAAAVIGVAGLLSARRRRA